MGDSWSTPGANYESGAQTCTYETAEAENQKARQRTYAFKNPVFRTRFVQTLLVLSMCLWGVAVYSGFLEFTLLNNIKHEFFETEEEMEAAANASDLRQGLIGLGQLGLTLTTLVALMMWVHRANNNARALTQETMEFTPGWSVGWFFVPIALFWKPHQVIKEIWQVSSKHSGQPVSSGYFVQLWWAAWLLSMGLSKITFRLQLRAEELDEFIQASTVSMLSDGADIVSHLLTFILVAQIFRIQTSSVPMDMCSPNDIAVLRNT